MALSPSGRSITNPAGANQNLWSAATKHDGAPNLSPNANRIQAGALARIHLNSPLGTPNKANPAGAQTS